MKRFAIFLLLAALSVAAATPVQAQRISNRENDRQTRKAISKQQKMLKKANKKQAKAMKKYMKQEHNNVKKANKNLRRR